MPTNVFDIRYKQHLIEKLDVAVVDELCDHWYAGPVYRAHDPTVPTLPQTVQGV